jgi:hypothetical protein
LKKVAEGKLSCSGLKSLAGHEERGAFDEWFRFALVPLNAALLWRQVAKAEKAVTSHRTPKFSGLAPYREFAAYRDGSPLIYDEIRNVIRTAISRRCSLRINRSSFFTNESPDGSPGMDVEIQRSV